MHLKQGWTILTACLVTSLSMSLAPRACRAGDWVLPESRLGIRTAPLLLLSRPDIQSDLQLDQRQIAGVHQTIETLTRRASALRGKSGGEAVAGRRAIDEAQLEWLTRNLTGNQLERLRQIELQWEGISAILSRPAVAEYLRLDPEQRQRLAGIIAERNRLRGRNEATAQTEAACQQRALSILNPTQQELWTNVLGKPLQMAATSSRPATRDNSAQRTEHIQSRQAP
jgi:hypothetical protein